MPKITFKQFIKAFIPYGFLVLYRKRKKVKAKNGEGDTLKLRLIDRTLTNVYGTCAEDLLLRVFCEAAGDYKGFYVDIGAFHPIDYSNTNYYYQNGWSGINIDASPSSIEKFNEMRKRDINIETGVSDDYGELEYYSFDEDSSLNTFDRKNAKKHEDTYNIKVMEIKKVQVQPINVILGKHLTIGQHIDFMTIDVEGFELRILKSLDFNKYAPDYFLLEDLEIAPKGFDEIERSPISVFLKTKGYNVVGAVDWTILYKKEKNI